MPRPLCSPFFGATYCVSLSLGTCLLLFGRHVGRFCLYRAGSIFGTRASGSRGIGIPSSLRGGTHPPVLAPPNARHHGRTWRDGCVFAASLLLVQATSAILEKPSVWDRKPSRTLSVVLPPFRLGNRLPFFLACRFGNGVKIRLFCESLSAISTFKGFRQLCDVFYDEGMPFVDADCQDVLLTG